MVLQIYAQIKNLKYCQKKKVKLKLKLMKNSNIRVEFKESCLKQDFCPTQRNVVNCFFVFELDDY